MDKRGYINRGLLAGTLMSIIGVIIAALTVGDSRSLNEPKSIIGFLIFILVSVFFHTILLRHSLQKKYLWWRIIGCGYGLSSLLGLVAISIIHIGDMISRGTGLSLQEFFGGWGLFTLYGPICATVPCFVLGTIYYLLLKRWKSLHVASIDPHDTLENSDTNQLS